MDYTHGYSVGDRVRVTGDTVPSNIGRTGRITELDRTSGMYPYLVEFDDADGGDEWVSRVERLGSTTAELRTGDYVEITTYRLSDSRYEGKRGQLTAIDTDDIPYRVDFSDGNYAWAREVRKLDAPTTPAPSPFAAHVEEAKRLLNGTDHTGADVIRLAEKLHEAA